VRRILLAIAMTACGAMLWTGGYASGRRTVKAELDECERGEAEMLKAYVDRHRTDARPR
jgi:hypothetical protein